MKKNIQSTISIKPETRNNLMKLKYKHGFTSVDSLIRALIKNNNHLKEVLKNETKTNRNNNIA